MPRLLVGPGCDRIPAAGESVHQYSLALLMNHPIEKFKLIQCMCIRPSFTQKLARRTGFGNNVGCFDRQFPMKHGHPGNAKIGNSHREWRRPIMDATVFFDDSGAYRGC